jgi:hypothetical protein
MGIVKKFLMLVLLVVAAGAAVIYGSRYIPNGKLDGIKQAANQVQPFISTSIHNANLGQLSQYGGQVSSQVQSLTGKVLGAQTSAVASSSSQDKNAQSLPQKTVDFVRYNYCKEVVKEYESRQ